MTRVRTWLQRLAAMGMALHPLTLVPFGLLRLVGDRRGGRSDVAVGTARPPRWGAVLFVAGAIAWWIPALLAGRGWGTSGALQVAALLAVALSIAWPLRRPAEDARLALVARGAAVGAVALAVLAVTEAIVTGARAGVWFGHPNVLGAAAAAVAVATATVARTRPGLASAGAGAGLVVVLASGSRGSLLAVAVGLAWLGAKRSRRPLLVIAAVAVVTVAAASLHPRIGPAFRSAVAFALDERSTARTISVLGSPPQAFGVDVEPVDAAAGSTTGDAAFRVLKRAEGAGARRQSPMILFPGRSYELRAVLHIERAGAAPGVLGVGRHEAGGAGHVRIVLDGDAWRVEAGERYRVEILEGRLEAEGRAVLRASLTNVGATPVRMWIGPGPHLGEGGIGTELTVEAFEVTGPAVDRWDGRNDLPLEVVQALDRIDALAVARRGWNQRPWLGHGPEAFSAYARWHPASHRTSLSAHAHHALLQTLFEGGVVGALGLLAMGVAALSLAPAALAPLATTVIIANTFDATLWPAQALLVLVAVGGVLGSGRTRTDD